MTDVSSEECSVQFSCKEKSSATAKLQVFNPSFETFGVLNLKTPMATHETALLRSADVSFIEFRYAESWNNTLFLSGILFDYCVNIGCKFLTLA